MKIVSILIIVFSLSALAQSESPTPTPHPVSKEEAAKRFKECSVNSEAFKACKEKYKVH
jgi:hypothetical protein